MSFQVNYDDALAQLDQAHMIFDKPLRFDAKIQRWKVEGEGIERRGWTRLKEWVSPVTGNVFLVGLYGVWQGNDDGRIQIQLPKKDNNAPALSADEIAALRASHQESIKRVEAERKLEAQTAARWAATVWHHCQPCTDHEYLTRKQIQPHGTRILPDVKGLQLPGVDESNFYRLTAAVGALVVPMHDPKGNVCGIQFVYPKAHPRKIKIERDKEFWPSGMAMGGTFGVIGSLRRNGVLLIAEGFATAASLHQATGQSVAYAFSANNLLKAAKQIRKAYPALRLLFCADDDYLTDGNPGVTAAGQATAALEHTAWVKPDFTAPDGADLRAGKKLTDFNDLHALTGLLPVLATQINTKLDELKWRDAPVISVGVLPNKGGGESTPAMPSRITVDDAAARYWGTYGMGGKVLFDEADRRLVHKDDVFNLLPSHGWDELKKHPGWRVARDIEIGFDPTESDPVIRCNLFGGWPTQPSKGRCERLLELLFFLCSKEDRAREVYDWVLKWLAYPLQHRGAKMHSAIVVHGGQGTGKSRFFEAYSEIFGIYGRVLGQDALEDKFNADWAEKKLFILADEVLARSDMFHVKNRLKGFITGGTIRVNPKNIAAHTEKNQMNIVFLSNERQPIALENDDRRHCVIYVPPKPTEEFFAEVNEEITNGGVAALHHHLLSLDLGDFRPWTKPPMTNAKQDLIDLGMGSEERFMREWQNLELEVRGKVVPFCPCLGSQLYRLYEDWCKLQGEFRPRPSNHFLNFFAKQSGWTAGKAESTWTTVTCNDPKTRKMVVPSVSAMNNALTVPGHKESQEQLLSSYFKHRGEWLAAGFFAFEDVVKVG